MSLLDFIGSAAGVAGDMAGQEVQRKALEDQKQKDFARQTELQKMQNELLAQREIAIQSYLNEQKNKPLNDYAAAVAGHMGDTVPTDQPAPVTQTAGILDRDAMTGPDGKPIQSAGAGDVGLKGNIANLTAQIKNDPNMSDEDKRGALAQLNAQAAQENQANAGATPKTRKVTQTEAQELGMQDLLTSGNGPAYVAGRPLQVDKTLAVPDGGAIIDPKTGKVLFQNTGKADRQMAHEDFQATQQQNRLDQQEKLKRMELDPLGIGSGVSSQGIAGGASGKELLDAIGPYKAEMVKALAEGRMSFPSGAALKSPTWQSMLALVGQYDPSFDAVNYGARAATRKDFTSGKAAQSANALNTVLGHLDSLGQAADELNNTNVPLWNSLANSIQGGMGDPRVKKFEATKKAVVDELTRAWRGTGGSEGDIKTWSSTLDAANSPDQLHGVIGQLGELLESKINALNDQYSKGMGTASGGLNLISQNSAKTLEKIRKRAGMETAQQPSGVLTYDPATGGFH